MKTNTSCTYLTFDKILILLVIFSSCNGGISTKSNHYSNAETGFNYLKSLEGNWIVDGDKEGIFEWSFDLTSRDGVIIERLKQGTPTEMLSVYNIEDSKLIANHFCQLQNQPTLIAVNSDESGDLHFLCNGNVGSTQSDNELHMHGVHFKKTEKSLIIWMDMFKDGKKDFETKYELFRINSRIGQELINSRSNIQ